MWQETRRLARAARPGGAKPETVRRSEHSPTSEEWDKRDSLAPLSPRGVCSGALAQGPTYLSKPQVGTLAATAERPLRVNMPCNKR